MKIRKGRLETKGGFGSKTRKGRPECTNLGIPQGTLSELCASQNGSHICQHHHLKRSLPNKDPSTAGYASFDQNLISDLVSLDPSPTGYASFDQNLISDLVSLGTSDQTIVADSASFDQSVTCDLTSLDMSERITRADSASFDQSHHDCLASMDRGHIRILHHWIQMGRSLLLRLNDLGFEGHGHRSWTQ
ncbi:hypothetical protein V6N11_084315 [Hibiscus sabdariffa]|uniref:Uncharacterized protein n=1 Tax=Hibiscus sabdariffa TaxID=183260 RepID=A0ABR2QT82_9ROSI